MQRKLAATLITLLVVVMGSLGATLAFGDTPALGLDLQGGISVTQQPVGAFESETLDLAAERIRDRVDSLGVAEPEILRQGDAIVVNLPGVKNQQEAIELVQVTGQVYLRPVQGCIADSGTSTESTESTVPASTDATATTAASATTAAPGPSRRVNSTPTTEAPTTTETPSARHHVAGDDHGGHHDTDRRRAPRSRPTAAPTQHAGPDHHQRPGPVRSHHATAPAAARGGQCLVGPAAGTGEVFDNDASATVIGGGWGVTVGLRDGASGRDVWNAARERVLQRRQQLPQPSARDRARRRDQSRPPR
jgi:preprotein translocase subunit SecD